MADKVRGALTQIDWTKTPVNEVSINTRKEKKQAPVVPVARQQTPANRDSRPSSENTDDIPVNRYRSVVAPVKSGRDEERPISRQISGGSASQTSRHSVEQTEEDEDAQVYLGYLGSIKVPLNAESKGISAIQIPMRELYFPYREKQSLAQERVLSVAGEGVEVYYLPHPDADDPVTFTIPWEDILYVEPLKFSTKKFTKDKKTVRAAFEPSEAQRLALLGNRDSLYTALGKQHKHISLLKHPALLCMVVKSPQNNNDIFTHAYVCSTVEESVFLARTIRDELEALYRESLKTGKNVTPPGTINLASSQISLNTAGYKIEKTNNPIESKLKSKKKQNKKKDKLTYTTHTGEDGEDLGSFHFGMSADPTTYYPAASVSSDVYGRGGYSSEEEMPVNDNFVIGRPAVRTEQRQKSQSGLFSEMEQAENFSSLGSLRSNDSRPVGVVQPQVSNMRDAHRVLPAGGIVDKSKLKPTALHVKTKQYSDVTPELDLKLRMRQDNSDATLDPLAPRSVINPIADVGQEQISRKSFMSPTPGPINKMTTTQSFNPNAALPNSGWNEAVISNYKSKEKIDNRMSSAMVDTKELPKMKEDKKEMEMANLFAHVSVDSQNNTVRGDNPPSSTGAINDLHDALGFMP